MMELTHGVAPLDFDRATTVRPIDRRPGQFAVDLDPGWSALVGVHGGYLCALAVRAAELLTPGRVVRTMSTSFLRTARVGPAELSVREVRRGRSMTTAAVELVQADQLVLTSRLTLMVPGPGVEWGELQPLGLAPVADCVTFTPEIDLANFDRFDLRFDPDRLPFHDGLPAIGGYVRPLEARPVDAAWLVMAADCFPPPAFARAEHPVGGISVDLTVHVHRSGFVLADDAWLTGRFEAQESTGGLAVEHGRLMHADGTAVAESFHTRLTARR
ncbi:MAG: thioesterase family protein [Acidimicrobiales bacterium]